MAATRRTEPSDANCLESEPNFLELVTILHGGHTLPPLGSEPALLAWLGNVLSADVTYAKIETNLNHVVYFAYQQPNSSTTTRVASWLQPSGSETLAIVDLEEVHPKRPFSRVSSISTIAHDVRTMELPNTYILTFFCGLHTDPTDPLRGPAGMLRSLLFQLVVKLAGPYIDQRLKLIITKEEWRGLKRHDITDMLRLFEELIASYHTGARRIVCVIDGITHLVTKERPCAIDFVMDTLIKKVVGWNAKGNHTTSFKLLLTMPKLAHYSPQWLPKKNQTELKPRNPADVENPEAVNMADEITKTIIPELFFLPELRGKYEASPPCCPSSPYPTLILTLTLTSVLIYHHRSLQIHSVVLEAGRRASSAERQWGAG